MTDASFGTAQPPGIEGDRTAAGGGLTAGGASPFDQAPAPPPLPSNYDEIANATLRQSPVGVALDVLSRTAFPAEAGYNPYEDPQVKGTDYAQFNLDDFVGSRSAAETSAIISSINRRNGDLSVFARGGVPGIAAGFASSFLSPLTLLPMGGFLKIGEATTALGAIARAAETAGISAAAQGVHETVYQAGVEAPTAGQAAFNIGFATVLGGVLGAAGAGMSHADVNRLAERSGIPPGSDAEMAAAGTPAGVGAAVSSSDLGEGIVKGALGAEKVMAFQDPLSRTMNSPFREARLANRALNEIPVTLEDNAEGIATSPGGSAEYLSHEYDYALADTMDHMERQFAQYRFGNEDARIPRLRAGLDSMLGRAPGKMSFTEFKDAVHEALHSGDVHAVPEVAAAARDIRAKVEDPLKQEAIKVGLFPEDVQPGDDVSHVFRMWNSAAVAADRERLTGILEQDFGERQSGLQAALDKTERELEEKRAAEAAKTPDLFVGTPQAPEPKPIVLPPGHAEARAYADMIPSEVRSLAEESVNTILGFSPDRAMLPKDIIAGPRGPLKERLLRIPTAKVRDFVVRDIAAVERAMTRTMATDIALLKKFGSLDMSAEIAKINDEAARMIQAAPSRSASITASQKAALRDLSAMRDRMRGTYRPPSNPDGLLHRSVRTVMALNFVSRLGNVVASSISDPGHVIMNYGLNRVMRTAFQPMVRGLGTIKLAAREARLANAALDLSNHARQMSINDIMDSYGRGSKFERGVQWLTDRYGHFSLMDHWNQLHKEFIGIVAQTKMLQSIERVVAGNASKKEVEYLASNSIDANMAGRIHAQFAGEGSGNFTSWFNNSKVVDESGKPLAVYRGVKEGGPASSPRGIYYFSADRQYAENYATKRVENGRTTEWGPTHEVYLSLQNPKIIRGDSVGLHQTDFLGPKEVEELKAQGYDGVINYTHNRPADSIHDVQEIIAFRPDQIKPVGEASVGAGHGVKDGEVWWANTEAWTDPQAVRAVRAALHREINRTLITPGQDKPLWMSTELGKVIGQFHSFNIASVQRTILAGLQQRDAAALSGATLMLGLGYLSYWLKAQINGQGTANDNFQTAALNAFDNSGLAGWLMDANNVSTKLSGGAFTLQRLLGAKEPSRYQAQDIFSMFGPTATTMEAVAAAARGLGEGEVTQSTVHQIRSLIPLQNLFYLRWLFNAAEGGINNAFGIRKKAA